MDFFDVYALIALFTFYILLMSKILILRKKNEPVISLGKGKKGLDKLREYFYLIGLLFLTYLVIQSALNLPFIFIGELIVLSNHIIFKVLGFIALNFAIILFSIALKSFKDSFRMGIDLNVNHDLITTGIFKYSRNPVYLGIILLFLGFTLTYSNFFFIGSLIFITYSLNKQIVKEERLLTSTFKVDYLNYKNKTRRFF